MVITDAAQASPRSLVDTIARAILGGARWVSLREKALPPDDRLGLLAGLVELARPTSTAVFVHGDVEAAAALGLAGVHLPQGGDIALCRHRLGRRAVIGISTHTPAEAVRAAAEGADYVSLSPIFASDSKPGYGPALGLDGLRDACRRASCPVIALGGIMPGSAASCVSAGAAGLAVMGPIMRARDPAATVRSYLARIPGACR